MKSATLQRTLLLALSLAPAAGLAQSNPNPLTAAFTAAMNNVERNVLESAELMPEEHYSFKLSPTQRTFGEWVMHSAMANYNSCSVIKGEANPHAGHDMTVTGKPDLTRMMKESAEYCAAAVKGLDDQKALSEVTVGKNQVPRVRSMFGLIGTLNSHYGNMVGYMRAKGLVPPSTARAQKAAPAAPAAPRP